MKAKSTDGHNFGIQIIQAFFPKIENICEIDVVEGYNIDDLIKNKIENGDNREWNEIFNSIPDSELITNYETGFFGVARFFDDYKDDRYFVIDVVPKYNSWEHIKEGEVEGILLRNSETFEDERVFYSFGGDDIVFIDNPDEFPFAPK